MPRFDSFAGTPRNDTREPPEVAVERHDLCAILDRKGGEMSIRDEVSAGSHVIEKRAHPIRVSGAGLGADDAGATHPSVEDVERFVHR